MKAGTPHNEQQVEEELVLSAQAGCAESFAKLVRRLQDPLYQFLLVRSGDEGLAEELTHDTFVHAWQKLHRYRSRWRFSTWLFTLARRLAVTRYREAARRASVVEPAPVECSGQDPAEAASLREERHNIWGLARRVLNDEQLGALWLRYAEGWSPEEIGRVLGKRGAAARVLLHRARHKLAAHLDAGNMSSLPTSTAPALSPGLEGR